MKKSLLFILAFHVCTAAFSQKSAEVKKYNLPYKDTYVKEALVAENVFRTAKPETIARGSFSDAKKVLPKPYWKGHDREIEMYWKAWEICLRNIKDPLPGSGFVSSYVDVAYNGNIFMWDDAFITMFARYGTKFFPFQRTLDNFYAHQHPDGFICREIKADGADCFERYDPTSTGPNLLPWSEYIYFTQFGDQERLMKIFPALCAYYKWLKLNRTWRNGTYWSSGWGTGMDNMPRVESKYNMIWSNGHMVWLDATLQQIFTANLLLKMGFYLERWQEIEDFETEAKELEEYVRKNMYDEEKGFLFDQYADGSLSSTMGIYSYWALLTNVLSKDRMDRFVQQLSNTETFNRPHRVASLAANNPKYRANGRYWQGGVWSGANYMVLTGLIDKGYRKEAYDIALNHYNNVFEVYKNTGTFWEYYAPETAEPGFMARKDFVGWTGLTPIAIFIEDILGIRSQVQDKKMTIDVNRLEEYGIDSYPYGVDGDVSIKVMARNSASEEPKVVINTNVEFELTLLWGEKSKVVSVKKGRQTI